MRVLSTKIVNWSGLPFEFDEIPFIRITEIPLTSDTDLSAHLIFTSRNAVTFFLKQVPPEQRLAKKIYCVGEKTAGLLAANGLQPDLTASNAQELASKISDLDMEPGHFTFFCGNLRRDELPLALRALGHQLTERIIYQTDLTPRRLIRKYDVLLFFSPSAVASFMQENTITDEWCLCIGNTTAKALKKIHRRVRIAEQPSLESMRKKLIQVYQNDTKRSFS